MQNLQSLVGKNVRLFRGGPESRDGKLLDLQKDFLTLSTKNDGVVYYNLEHIKSIIKNSKDGNGMEANPPSSENNESFIKASSFHDLLGNMKHMMVRIDRGGPESRTGRLMDVFSDFLILNTEKDGVIYYKIHHIKSISRSADLTIQENKNKPHYVTAENFNDLLKKLKYSWVKINRGGPEMIEGVLVDNSEDHLILTVGDEINRIPTFHIRNINCVINQEVNSDDKEKEKKENKENQDEKSKDNNQNNDDKHSNDKKDKHDDGHDDKHDKKDKHDDQDKHDKTDRHDDDDLYDKTERHEDDDWDDDWDDDDQDANGRNSDSYEDRIEQYYEDKYEKAYGKIDSLTSNRSVWHSKRLKIR